MDLAPGMVQHYGAGSEDQSGVRCGGSGPGLPSPRLQNPVSRFSP